MNDAYVIQPRTLQRGMHTPLIFHFRHLVPTQSNDFSICQLVLKDQARITKEGIAPLITADGKAICTTTECVVAGTHPFSYFQHVFCHLTLIF